MYLCVCVCVCVCFALQTAFSYGFEMLKTDGFIKQRWDRLNPKRNCGAANVAKGESALGIKEMSGLLILSGFFFCVFVGAKLGKEIGLWNQPAPETGITLDREEDEDGKAETDAAALELTAEDMAVLKKVFGREIAFPAPAAKPVGIAVDEGKRLQEEAQVPQMQTITAPPIPPPKRSSGDAPTASQLPKEFTLAV